MLTLFQSTDPAVLFDAFARSMQSAQRCVFARSTVIVPSMTVRDDLDNRLADRFGISALLDAQFFGRYAWSLVESISDDPVLPGQPPLSQAAMQWRLFAALAAGSDSDLALIEQLTAHLPDASARQERLWQLAAQFARLFVRYIHLRPDWLQQWSAGQGASAETLLSPAEQASFAAQPEWLRAHYQPIIAAQQALWQRHFAPAYLARETRLARFWQALAQGEGRARLPQPLFVYALESIDADMAQFLHHLGEYTDIEVYYHAVSEGYFADMVDDRWLKRLQLRGDRDDQHRDPIHPLLSRLGKVQRELFRLWTDREDSPSRTLVTLPARHPPPTTLLATLQAELRELNPELLGGYTLRAEDDSLRLHACHGLMRQLEALRGELVRWFQADPSREPADVLIVLPDPESAQNLIHTVFPPTGDYDGHHLPARLTGITPPAAANRWQALTGLYTLPDSRFEAERVLAWLRRDDVCAMLVIAPEDMQQLCDALLTAGYRRGLNSEHLGSDDDDPRFTFCYALDRLITGLWMPDAEQYQHTIPLPQDDSAGLNALCQLALDWQRLWQERQRTRPVREWIQLLQSELASRFPVPDNASRTIELALRELDSQLATLDAHSPAPSVSLAFVLADIGSKLASEHTSSEPSGVMTIGRINAMRTLPYKLIAFVNANIADFPANPPDDRYDLTRLAPRAGDPKAEHDDLAAFLDILRHAGENLWIFYDRYPAGGHDEQLPAQPVQDLLAYLGEHLDTSPLIRHHAPDPYQHDAPDHHPPPLWHQVRQRLHEARAPTPLIALAHIPLALHAPLTETQTLNFTSFAQPLLRPIASWLQAHDLALLREPAPDPNLEPLHLDGLARYQLDEYLIADDDDPTLPHLPLLPAGAAGQALLDGRRHELAQRRAQLLAASGATHIPVLHEHPVTLDSHTITLPLPPRGAPHLILHPGKARSKHRLSLWWRHLLWQQAGGEGDTWCAFADGILHYRAVPDPAALLRAWLNVRQHSLRHPWLLPIDIGMLWAEAEIPDGERLQHTLRNWRQGLLAEAEKDTNYKGLRPSDSADAWGIIARGHDPATLNDYILEYAGHYGAALYAPLWTYLGTEKETGETP